MMLLDISVGIAAVKLDSVIEKDVAMLVVTVSVL